MLETIKCIGLIFFNATKLLFKKCGFTLVPLDELNFNMGEKKNRLIGSPTSKKTLHKLVLMLTIHIWSVYVYGLLIRVYDNQNLFSFHVALSCEQYYPQCQFVKCE